MKLGAGQSQKNEIRVAYVDHSFHRKTKSTLFFLEFLREEFTVDVFWDESWTSRERLDLDRLDEVDYQMIFFFQVLYRPEDLKKLKCQFLVFIPMYDAGGDQKGTFWLDYRRYWFISFSLTTHRNLRVVGVRSFYIQYFPDPASFPWERIRDGASVFFWARSNQISWSVVKRLLVSSGCRRFWIHSVPDPDVVLDRIDETDRRTFDVQESTWFETRDLLYSTILAHDLFVAPRAREGIGMSFLEAMAMGRCVVGADEPTMNEYIRNGRNGVLFRLGSEEPLGNMDNVAEMGVAARVSVEDGFLVYRRRLGELRLEMAMRLEKWPRPRMVPGFVFYSAANTALGLARRWKKALLQSVLQWK